MTAQESLTYLSLLSGSFASFFSWSDGQILVKDNDSFKVSLLQEIAVHCRELFQEHESGLEKLQEFHFDFSRISVLVRLHSSGALIVVLLEDRQKIEETRIGLNVVNCLYEEDEVPASS